MVVAGNLVEVEVGGMTMEAAEVAQEEPGYSEAHVVSEADEGISESHTTAKIVEIRSSTSSDTRSNSL